MGRIGKTVNQKDYYEILGLEAGADQSQIRDAYRRLALLYHPDRNKDSAEATERMKEINESYAVLSEPRKRREYDALRQAYGSSAYGQFRQTHSDQDIFRDSDIQQIFEELSRAFGFRGFDEVFRQSYGAGYRTFEFKKPGVFGRVVVGGLGEGSGVRGGSLLGGYLEKLIRYSLKKKWGIELPERGKDLRDAIVLSPDQARLGGKVRYSSGSSGRELFVTIPPDTKEGRQLRLRGMGEPGRAGGEAGDLYVTVRIGNRVLWMMKNFLARIRSALRLG